MPPSAQTYHENSSEGCFGDSSKDFLNRAAAELESMRSDETMSSSFQPMPLGCLQLLRSLPGNQRCVDCGAPNPQWASISYGCLLCVQCCGRHRSYGVNVSRVRSITMDTWLHRDVISMLEGGNHQLAQFFDRHELSPRSSTYSTNAFSFDKQTLSKQVSSNNYRYRTKAARFYRENMLKHVSRVISRGRYEGRQATRKRARRTCKSKPKCESESLSTRTNMRKAIAVGS